MCRPIFNVSRLCAHKLSKYSVLKRIVNKRLKYLPNYNDSLMIMVGIGIIFVQMRNGNTREDDVM